MTLHWCGVYTRQSREAEGEFSSCQAQFEACLAFASDRLEPARWICSHRYEDAGESGESLDRPGLQRLLSDVREGVVERVLVQRLDRLSRRLTDCVEILTRFRDCGVPLTVVTEPELGTTASDALALNLLASFAEFEQEMHRDRLTEARAALKARGRRVAGLVPYGYVSDPVTKQLQVDPTEADVVVTMFRWAAAGRTPAEIAELANEQGWRTKRRVSKRGRESGGNPWTPRQVAATLANPVYLGRIRDGEGSRPGLHAAVVDESLFEQARSRLESRRTRDPGRGSGLDDWWLRGLLLCGACRRPMSSHTVRRGSVIYPYYRCRSHGGGRPPCKGVMISRHEIEQFVLRCVSDPSRWNEDDQETRQLARTLALVTDESRPDRARLAGIRDLVHEIVFDMTGGEIAITFRDPTAGR